MLAEGLPKWLLTASNNKVKKPQVSPSPPTPSKPGSRQPPQHKENHHIQGWQLLILKMWPCCPCSNPPPHRHPDSTSPTENSTHCKEFHELSVRRISLIHLQVDFEQFKDALILVLSSSIEPPQEEQEVLPKPGKVLMVVHKWKSRYAQPQDPKQVFEMTCYVITMLLIV